MVVCALFLFFSFFENVGTSTNCTIKFPLFILSKKGFLYSAKKKKFPFSFFPSLFSIFKRCNFQGSIVPSQLVKSEPIFIHWQRLGKVRGTEFSINRLMYRWIRECNIIMASCAFAVSIKCKGTNTFYDANVLEYQFRKLFM